MSNASRLVQVLFSPTLLTWVLHKNLFILEVLKLHVRKNEENLNVHVQFFFKFKID